MDQRIYQELKEKNERFGRNAGRALWAALVVIMLAIMVLYIIQ